METLGGVAGSSPEQLSATINKLELRFHKESSRSGANLPCHFCTNNLRLGHDVVLHPTHH